MVINTVTIRPCNTELKFPSNILYMILFYCFNKEQHCTRFYPKQQNITGMTVMDDPVLCSSEKNLRVLITQPCAKPLSKVRDGLVSFSLGQSSDSRTPWFSMARYI